MGTHEGRVAVVTGAARGIGRAAAVVLAARGAGVALLDIDDCTDAAADVAAVGGRSVSVVIDVGSPAAWADAAGAIEAQLGPVDILVNNAGVYPLAPFGELSYELWSRVLRTNLDSQFLGCAAFVPGMRMRGWGRIVNIASNSIGSNTVGLSHYMASKMGVIGFTRGLANDLGDCGITVNALAPALTDTPGTSAMSGEFVKAKVASQAIKSFAKPEDIVGPLPFLTSDDARFVTGQLLVVDGGMLKN